MDSFSRIDEERLSSCIGGKASRVEAEYSFKCSDLFVSVGAAVVTVRPVSFGSYLGIVVLSLLFLGIFCK